MKTPIKLLGRFGHSCNYDKVRLIETADAELAQKLRALEKPLPVLPADETDKVLTFFWWDNFDIKKDNSVGSLHTTHGVAYQEKSTNNISIPVNISIKKSKIKTISLQPLELPTRKILPHKNPPSFEDSGCIGINQEPADKLLLLWKLMRRLFSSSSQTVSRFVGWVIKALGRPGSQATKITFLPPIRTPITDYSTAVAKLHFEAWSCSI